MSETPSRIPPNKPALTPDWWVPRNLTEALALAETIASSSVVPKSYAGRPGDVLVAMQMGAEVGLSPMASLQNIAVINGRPSLWGDSMLAVCKGHRDWEWFSEIPASKENSYVAVCTVKRRGEPECQRTFSIEDAKLAGLWGKTGPWTQYPRRMLSLRARAFALRDSFPDALRGIASAEESMDIDATFDVRPAPGAVHGSLPEIEKPIDYDTVPGFDDDEETDPDPERAAVREEAKQ